MTSIPPAWFPRRIARTPATEARQALRWALTDDERRQIAEAIAAGRVTRCKTGASRWDRERLTWDPSANRVSPTVVVVARKRRAERRG